MGDFRRRFGRSGLGPSGRFFGPGELRLALLALIAERPAHGYELMARLEARFEGAYRASPGAIYPTLQQIEDEGLVLVEPRDGRKVHRVTADGQAEIDAHAADIAGIWRRASSRGEWGVFRDPDVAEIVGPALRLMKAAAKAVVHAHGDPEVVDRIRAVFDDARQNIERMDRRRR